MINFFYFFFNLRATNGSFSNTNNNDAARLTKTFVINKILTFHSPRMIKKVSD